MRADVGPSARIQGTAESRSELWRRKAREFLIAITISNEQYGKPRCVQVWLVVYVHILVSSASSRFDPCY